MKITDNFCYTRSAILEAIQVLPQTNTPTVVEKGNGTQRKTKVSKRKGLTIHRMDSHLLFSIEEVCRPPLDIYHYRAGCLHLCRPSFRPPGQPPRSDFYF